MPRKRTNANLTESSIQASAERELAKFKAARIAKAEANLSNAQTKLAEAQGVAERAAAALAAHDWDGNRREVLAAREQVELCASQVEHFERELGKVRQRPPAAVREAIVTKVTAERRLAALADRRVPVEDKIRKAAAALIGHVREMGDLTLEQGGAAFELKDAREALGAKVFDHDHVVPDPRRLAAAAIASACVGLQYSPFDFADLGRWVSRVHGDAKAAARPSVHAQPMVAPDGEDNRRRAREAQDRYHATSQERLSALPAKERASLLEGN